MENQPSPRNDLKGIGRILRIEFLIRLIVVSLFGGFYLLGSSLIAETNQAWLNFFQGWLFSLSVLTLSIVLNFFTIEFRYWKYTSLISGCIILVLWLLYFNTSSTLIAWIATALSYAFIIHIGRLTSAGRSRFYQLAIGVLFALGIGFTTIALVQIESNFAEEEFFSAIYAFVLSGYWFLLFYLDKFLYRSYKKQISDRTLINRPALFIVLCISVILGLIFFIRSYQHSFYPKQAPSFTGINSNTPYICAQVQPDKEIYEGQAVFEGLMKSLESIQQKSSPEYGMLALGTGDSLWAEKFRQSILEEARLGKYTEPAGSVKYGQYEASFRVYYYSQIIEKFPDLFSKSEKDEMRNWFEAINRRALSVEPVDWLYAIAFSKLPEGPYENQETGTGLLALLESQGLADPESTMENHDYLRANLSGWTQRFRNTDDAAVYQPEWINNSFYQSLFTESTKLENIRLSFEWLLLQALPDGAPLKYNHIGSASFESLAYLGATLLKDDRYIWLSGKALDYKIKNGARTSYQPGVEKPVNLTGESPTQGSCLLFGGSGLPNQIGPLAPDKIVFRNGWADDSIYLLLNLRFSGWHRYKATNTLTLLYQSGALASDQMSDETFKWLPVGRSLFRDKRIPRENLNGLIIEKVGLSKVIYELTGLGSPWAQDPPYYARVEEFTTGMDINSSTTLIDDWNGWFHQRKIHFFHEGPVVIIDEARGPEDQTGGISWNLVSEEILEDNRLQLRSGENPVQVIFLPFRSDVLENVETTSYKLGEPNVRVQYLSNDGYLSLATIFLTEDWIGGQAQITKGEQGSVLEIIREGDNLQLPLNPDMHD